MATPTSRRSQTSRQRTPRAARGNRSTPRSSPGSSSLLGNAAFLLLGLAILALGGAVVAMGQHRPTRAATGGGSTTSSTRTPASNAQGQSGDWISLRSNAPADILAAARQSSLFQQNLAGSGDHVSDLSRLGSPVMVRALQPPGATIWEYPDFYVVPVLDASGAATDAAELALNPTRTAIQVIAIVTYSQPHPQGSIARLSSSSAIAAVAAQQHSALRSGVAPWLVYFPADATAQETGQVTWTGGGEYPADPMWLVPGADGRDHLVGVDGRAYSPAQLPMIAGG